MHLDPADRQAVLSILERIIPGYEVWAFGSRVHGKNLKPFSDLDLALPDPAPLPLDTLSNLREAFQASDLPFKVDIIERAFVDPVFWDIVVRDHEVLAAPTLQKTPTPNTATPSR
jgi:predicted nucleotidyltransferase